MGAIASSPTSATASTTVPPTAATTSSSTATASTSLLSMPTVVVTHHAPLRELAAHDALASAYDSDLRALIEGAPQVQGWYFGHIHTATETLVGACKVKSNPRGYVDGGQESGWDTQSLIEIN